MNEELRKKYEKQHIKTSQHLSGYLAERTRLYELQKEMEQEVTRDEKKMQRRSRELAKKEAKEVTENE